MNETAEILTDEAMYELLHAADVVFRETGGSDAAFQRCRQAIEEGVRVCRAVRDRFVRMENIAVEVDDATAMRADIHAAEASFLEVERGFTALGAVTAAAIAARIRTEVATLGDSMLERARHAAGRS